MGKITKALVVILVIILVLYKAFFGGGDSHVSEDDGLVEAVHTPRVSAYDNMVDIEYDPTIDEEGATMVPFGDGCFVLRDQPMSFDDDNFDFYAMAKKFGHVDNVGYSGREYTASQYAGLGTDVAICGEKDGSVSYIYAYVHFPQCAFCIKFPNGENSITLSDGSKISPLMAKMAQYVFETFCFCPERARARFEHLEKLAAGVPVVDVELYYDIYTDEVTWEDVEHVGVKRRGNFCILEDTLRFSGFLESGPIMAIGGGRLFSGDGRSEIRFFPSYRGEDPYFEAQLGHGVSVSASFVLSEFSEDELMKDDGGGKAPLLMYQLVALAAESISEHPDLFEERFDFLEKTAPESVDLQIFLRSKTTNSSYRSEEEKSEEEVVAESVPRFGDDWISVETNVDDYIDSTGFFNLDGMVRDFQWRVDPRNVGEITILPQKNTFGYLVLNVFNVSIVGDEGYARVKIERDGCTIYVDILASDATEELVRFENGMSVPKRACFVVLKALETLRGDADIDVVFSYLEKTCPEGVSVRVYTYT